MGGGSSKQLEVQELKNSNAAVSPRGKNAKKANSPEKDKTPPMKKKVSESPYSLQAIKTSQSTLVDNTRSSEQIAQTKSKKKIKSVRRLPQGLERQQKPVKETFQEEEQLNQSSSKIDRKAKNDKIQLNKLMKIYDIA